MLLLDRQPLVQLRDEFRLSMRRLLKDLCRELHADHADLAEQFGLPTTFFEALGSALPGEAYSNWKVVGWIEALNDLVYLLDILRQWRAEEDRTEFSAQMFQECQEKFFEHGYLDDLFPDGRAQAAGLEKRLIHLSERLVQELTQESLWFDPALTVKWCLQRKMKRWDLGGNLQANVERSEAAGTIPVGIVGAWCEAPPALRRALKRTAGRVRFRVERTGILVKAGTSLSPVWTCWGVQGQWHWRYHEPVVATHTGDGLVTVGPTLVYGRDRQPRTVAVTHPDQMKRIARAWRTISLAWPEGQDVLSLLTARLVPLKANGVVSFSYRHRPGLSFINCFDRDNLDLIDDLIHENSHHHLNLLLRKHVLYQNDHNQQIFYSPWRRSLRPLRGILHATFTFTMGAMLFERLSSWAAGKGGTVKWNKAGLTARDLRRARCRCLEEVASVRYSIQDLHYADHHLGWLTGSGRRLVRQLTAAIDRVQEGIARHEQAVLRSEFGPALRRHVQELQEARRAYGPMTLSKA